MPLPPDRVDYSPIIDRPIIKWPNDARVALWISPNVEHYEYMPDDDTARTPWPRTPFPDVQQYSYRDYGNRVGFWRMLESLDRYNIRCCVSLNMAVLEHFPEIGQAMVERDYDYMRPASAIRSGVRSVPDIAGPSMPLSCLPVCSFRVSIVSR